MHGRRKMKSNEVEDILNFYQSKERIITANFQLQENLAKNREANKTY
jgi:hypothetical protein